MNEFLIIVGIGIGSGIFCGVAIGLGQYVLTFGHLPSRQEIAGLFR